MVDKWQLDGDSVYSLHNKQQTKGNDIMQAILHNATQYKAIESGPGVK